MLAERGYETLYEYGESGDKKPLQEYELQQMNNNYVFSFENYQKRCLEEEELAELAE